MIWTGATYLLNYPEVAENMSRNKNIFTVKGNSGLQSVKSSLFQQQATTSRDKNSGAGILERRELLSSFYVIVNQMRISGKRERTIYDYERYFLDYQKKTGQKYIDEITVESIYLWLELQGDVKNSTKQIRLKSFKAVLGRFFQNGWVNSEFWKQVNVKVDKTVKKPASDSDVMTLLSVLDFTVFTELRDATAILLMYKTGIRLATMSNLKEEHVDLQNGMLNLSGDIMKNHLSHKLPISDELCIMLDALIQHNHQVRQYKKVNNSFIFITSNGLCVQRSMTNNVIQKRLKAYSQKYGFSNLNSHGLRRGFANNLLKQDAPLPLISKALHHSDLAVTSVYLNLTEEQVADDLKKYL